ncbi:MAG: NAD+ synthase, partial [Planctomycetota bacterium]
GVRTVLVEDGAPLVVGAPWRADGPGKPLYNAAVLVRDGTCAPLAKSLLPTYDVFDERRYFRPAPAASVVEVDGVRVDVTICEDVWTGALYPGDPVEELADRGAQVILNLSASPFRRGKPAHLRDLLGGHARRRGVPHALCNLVGANDGLIIDGNSFAVDRKGRLCAHAASFREDLLVTDFSGRAEPGPQAEDLVLALELGIRDYFRKTGFDRALAGLSGGIDSSLLGCLAAGALGPRQLTGVAMPGPFSSDASLEDARALAGALGIHFRVVPVGRAYDLLLEELRGAWGDAPFDEAEENLQARLRGVTLMALANKQDALVLVPSNKSELAMGYCTLYGDMVGALAPIADLYKGEVYDLAERFRDVIPDRVFERAPSAELRPHQTDQDTLPPYDVLDGVLRLHIEERRRAEEIVAAGFAPETVERVLRQVARAEYKRHQTPPVLKVTEKAFGLGRRFPIVERFARGEA